MHFSSNSSNVTVIKNAINQENLEIYNYDANEQIQFPSLHIDSHSYYQTKELFKI
jgi:hypothetical protein